MREVKHLILGHKETVVKHDDISFEHETYRPLIGEYGKTKYLHLYLFSLEKNRNFIIKNKITFCICVISYMSPFSKSNKA